MITLNVDPLKPAQTTNGHAHLLPCLARLAQLQHESIDRLALQEAAEAASRQHANEPQAQLETVATHLQVGAAHWLNAPDASRIPALAFASHGQSGHWGVLRGQNAQGEWISEWWDGNTQRWQERADAALPEHVFATFKLARPYVASKSAVYRLIRDEVFAHRKLLREAVLGGLMINVVALATSFYSMQVYDRVIPTHAG